jgi:mercuric ion transport protein
MRLSIMRVVGSLGSIFAALCCLGVPALLAALSAAGVGFLINDAILFPLLFVSLGITIFGSYLTFRQHRNRLPLVVTIICSVLIVAGIFLALPRLVYSGLTASVLTQVGDWAYQQGWWGR